MREKAIRSGTPRTGTPEAWPRDSGHFLSDNERWQQSAWTAAQPRKRERPTVFLFDQVESTCLGF